MKKLSTLLLVCLLITIPVCASASHVPLQSQGKYVYLSDEINVNVISFLANLTVRKGFTSVNTSMVVKNQNPTEPAKFLMGVPVQLDNVSKIRNLSVRIGKNKLKFYKRRALDNPPNGKKTDIKYWYVWSTSMEPGETKVVDCAFSIDNKIDRNGTESVIFPLSQLTNWGGEIKHVQVIADLDFYEPYVFEPNPSIIPNEYADGGRLTWRFQNIDSIPSDLELSFRPIDVVAKKYIEEKSGSNKEINSIVDLYESKDYDTAIQKINEFLSANTDFELEQELKFIKLLCYQELYQTSEVLNLINDLEKNTGFGPEISNTIKNKLFFDKLKILKTYGEENKVALEYLKAIKPNVKSNEVFMMWIENEIKKLTPPPRPPVKEEVEPEVTKEQEVEKKPEQDSKKTVIKKVEILGYEIPVEILLLAAVLLVIVLFALLKRRKRRNRYSIFR